MEGLTILQLETGILWYVICIFLRNDMGVFYSFYCSRFLVEAHSSRRDLLEML